MPAGAVCPCGALTTRPSRRCENCERRLADRKALRRSVYEDPRWERTRELTFFRDGYACVDCGMTFPSSKLQADHDPMSIEELVARGLDPFDPRYCKTRDLRCHGRRGGQRLRR